ncbi:MAG: aminotransferase class I/II-fold pyridoxal phosphate-dependent enzyme [Flavobacteriales bacterium]
MKTTPLTKLTSTRINQKDSPLKQRVDSFDIARVLRETGFYPYFRTITSDQDTVVSINGKEVLMFGSNSYLGLTNHPKVKEACKDAIDKYGSGCAGSRFLNGTLDLHLELEKELASFVGKEDALVFSTGYQVNLGVISALTRRNDYIILDELDHACIIDGARLSFAKTLKYAHNDLDSLEKALQRTDPERLKLICVDGVFSMEGDIVNLSGVVSLAKKYNASIMLDDAHGLGVLGESGQGTAYHCNLTDDVDLIMGTFSKSLASIGGYVAGDADTIDYLKHNSRSLMFSASISPGNAAGALASLNVLKNEPERLDNLKRNTIHAQNRLLAAGFEIGMTQTPIIPIYVRDNIKTFRLTQQLLELGVFVNPVVTPAVPAASSLIRYSLMATHTISQIDESVDKMIIVGKELGII